MSAPSPVEVQAMLRVATAALADATEFIEGHMATCTDLGLSDATLSRARLVLEHLTAAQRGLSRIREAG